MHVLDARRLSYEVFLYPATIHSASKVAGLLGVDAAQVFKTLVMVADAGRHGVAVRVDQFVHHGTDFAQGEHAGGVAIEHGGAIDTLAITFQRGAYHQILHEHVRSTVCG